MNAKTTPDAAIQLIPLNKLSVSAANVRRTDVADDIPGLAASIEAHGLLQNLSVLMGRNGRAEVVAGQRRLLALQYLAKQKKIPADFPVPCRPVDMTLEQAREISLAENTMRQAMHPDDEFEAFNDLVVSGTPIEDVAQRYGVTPAVVKQRLKLAAVSPKLRKLFRAGKMTLQQVMAFTLTDDVKKQEEVRKELSEWDREDPDAIRHILTDSAVEGTNRMARFVTLKVYEKAGGNVIKDLFGEETSTYFADAELLQRLAAEKLEAAAEAVRAEGWAWVKPTLEHGYEGIHYGRLKPTNQGKDHDDLEDEADVVPTFDAKKMKGAGAKVYVDYNGKLVVERGLIIAQSKNVAIGEDSTPGHAPDEKPAYSARLMDELANQHTAALRHALSLDANAALATLAHSLAGQVMYDFAPASALNIRAVSARTDLPQAVPNPEECSAQADLAKTRSAWQKKLPKDPEKLFAWLMKQDRATISDLLVFSTALTLQATSPGYHDHDRRAAAASLTPHLTPAFDMAGYWEPTAEGFLSRLSKAQMAQALEEVGASHGAAQLAKMKKDAAAVAAARDLKGKGWLPAPLMPDDNGR